MTHHLATAATVLFATSLISAAETPKRPNVVFVLADDLGWAELGCYGNRFNETPHLDRLASQGMRFTQAYAAAPVCSPYRAALLTGQHPARTGITDYLRPNSANALSTDHATLAETLQADGYAAGMIGKWHLTGYRFHDAEYEVRPTDHGFGWNFGSEVKGVGNGANFWPYVFRDQPIRWIDVPQNRLGEDEYLTDRLNVEAVDFIERNRDRPFFLYLSHYAPHSILNGRPDLVKKYLAKHPPGPSGRDRCYLCEDAGLGEGDPGHHWSAHHNPHLAAMLESIDDGIGRIAAKLEELELAENTIVIFTSDNGGEMNVTSNAPLRGGKSQLFEGGIRVPLIVRWPDAVPASTLCTQPTVNLDFYPTLLEAAGIEPDQTQTLDGVSTLATWKDPTRSHKRETLYWHYPLDRPHFLGGVSSGAVREGDWKLIEDFDSGRRSLYSLADDVSESRDLADDKPELVARLAKKLEDWRRGIDARRPSPPLLARPRQLSFADHFSSLPGHDAEQPNERTPAGASERWFFNKDWSVEDGALLRNKTGSPTTRIFLRDASFQDVVIRFDFQRRQSQDVRLVTGASGHYNAVVHIRPDHFYLQTAKDESGPWFSYRHGECAYDFEPDRWYTMTVEFLGDQLVAHIDRDHLAYAKHPILDQQRTYFALQVDESDAAFDNVQILTAAPHSQLDANLKHIAAAQGRHPVEKPLAEQFDVRKRNAHEWFYQRHEEYRRLVERVDELDALKKDRYPEVFRSHKEFRKQISSLRRKLLAEDPVYKETLHATHRADRAVTAWLIRQAPEVDDLPDSRRKHELERLRAAHEDHPDYLKLVALRDAAQNRLESDYPKLFLTDEQINRSRQAERAKVAKSPTFRELTRERAAAYRAQQDYLFEHDEKLDELRRRLDEETAPTGEN